MRVLWFTNTPSCYSQKSNVYNGGGWISSLESELKKVSGIELGVCFYSGRSGSGYRKEEQDGTVYYLLPRPVKSVSYIIRTVFADPEKSTWYHEKLAIPALVKIVNDFQPDVIHVFGSENIYGILAAYVPIPVVLHIQGILTTCLNAFLPPFVSWGMYMLQDKSLKNILRRMSDRIAWRRNSVTEQRMVRVVKYYMGRTVWDERVTRLLNPDAEYYHCDEILRSVFYTSSEERKLPTRPVFVTTISSQYYKGFDLVLKTAEMLKTVSDDFEWLVFGDINPKFLEKVFKIRHGDVNIRMVGVGSAEQIKDAILHSTAYVHTSYIDNASNSLCEAQILGVPGIATNVGGIPSVIDDGVSGFLVPANDPYQMAYLMKYLYDNKEMNIAMGRAAKEAALKDMTLQRL